jgi:hypothetical protein
MDSSITWTRCRFISNVPDPNIFGGIRGTLSNGCPRSSRHPQLEIKKRYTKNLKNNYTEVQKAGMNLASPGR